MIVTVDRMVSMCPYKSIRLAFRLHEALQFPKRREEVEGVRYI